MVLGRHDEREWDPCYRERGVDTWRCEVAAQRLEEVCRARGRCRRSTAVLYCGHEPPSTSMDAIQTKNEDGDMQQGEFGRIYAVLRFLYALPWPIHSVPMLTAHMPSRREGYEMPPDYA